MNKEKRNIATKLETESKYLTNILDKDDVKNLVAILRFSLFISVSFE